MPQCCCIKNCKNRWDYTARKNIQFHRFPKEITVRQQWLKACQRKESDIKLDWARICSIHFEKNCFALVKTKRQLKNQPVKEILRLKKGSIPTKFLNLEEKRGHRMSQSKKDNKKINVPGKSFVSTYTDLVQYAQQKQRLSQEDTVTKMETDVAQNIEEDLMQLRMSRQLNQRLLDKNKNLKKRIRDLSTQVAQLQAEIKNMTKNKHKEAKTTAIDALRKIFTPNQITMLMSPTKNRVK